MKKILTIVGIVLLLTSCNSSDKKSKEYDILNNRISVQAKIMSEQNIKILELEEKLNLMLTKVQETEISIDEKVNIREIDKELKEINSGLSRIVNDLKDFNFVLQHVEANVSMAFSYIRKLPGYQESVFAWVEVSDSNTLESNTVEWITSENIERINDLNLDEDSDFPNGFYIYDAEEIYETLNINQDYIYYVLDDYQTLQLVGYQEFVEYVKQYGNRMFCSLIYFDGELITIAQNYLP